MYLNDKFRQNITKKQKAPLKNKERHNQSTKNHRVRY